MEAVVRLSAQLFRTAKVPYFASVNIVSPFARHWCLTRCVQTACVLKGSAARAETTSTTQGLSKLQAQELVLRLNEEERTILISALQEYQSKLIKDEYEGKRISVFVLVDESGFCLLCFNGYFSGRMDQLLLF